MGLLDGLLGGGGGDIPPSSKLKNLDITDQAFKNLRGQLAGLLGGSTSGTSTLPLSGVPDYTGKYSAPATGQETSLIDALFGRAGGTASQGSLNDILSQFTSGSTPLQQAGQSNILDTLSGKYLDPSTNPFLTATIKAATDPITQAWQENVLPNLKIGFSKAGQSITGFGSSPFDKAAALAGNDYLSQISKASTDIASQNYQAERDRIMQALGLGQSATGQEIGAQNSNIGQAQNQTGLNQAERAQQTQELVTTLQSVALPRLIEQYGLDQGTTEFRNRLQVLLQLLGMEGTLATGTTVNAPSSPAAAGGIGSLLQGAGGLAGGISTFF